MSNDAKKDVPASALDHDNQVVEGLDVAEKESGLDALRGMNLRLQEEVLTMVVRKEAESALQRLPEYSAYPLAKRRAAVAEIVATLLGLDASEVKFSMPPPNVDADFAISIFKIWPRTEGQDNKSVTSAFADFMPTIVSYAAETLPFGVAFEQKGIFLNIKFDRADLVRDVIGCVDQMGDKFGNSDVYKGEKVVVDFSSPNTAKTMHMGHLRGTIIGQVLMNLLNATGATAYGINHLGDWGTQFGQLVTAYKMWGSDVAAEIDRETEPVRYLATLYKMMKQAMLAEQGVTPENEVESKALARDKRKLLHEQGHDMDEAEADVNEVVQIPTPLADEGRANFAKLEAGDAEVVALWDEFRRLSLIEFNRIYDRLGITFDKVLGESFYEDKMADPIQRAKDIGLAKQDKDGALVLDFGETGVPPAMILKPDGGTLYLTRDVAAIKHRMDSFKATRIWYVIGSEQRVHLRQIFEAAKQLGDIKGDECRHVANGLMTVGGRKIASREGAGGLEEFLDTLRDAAKTILSSGDKADKIDASEVDEIAETLAMGAIIYANFAKSIDKDMEFDPAKMLDLASQTGAYLQYTAVRLNSLLANLGEVTDDGLSNEMISEFLPEVHTVLDTVSRFPEIVAVATDKSSPEVLARYLYDLATQFNSLYSASKRSGDRFVKMDPSKKAAYAKVFNAIVVTLTNGLRLLHIKVPSKM